MGRGCGKIDSRIRLLRIWHRRTEGKNRMEQRRPENIFYRIIRVFSPLVVYYIIYCAAYLILVTVCDAVVSHLPATVRADIGAHAETLTELLGGLAMLAGVLPLIPSLRTELAAAGHDFAGQCRMVQEKPSDRGTVGKDSAAVQEKRSDRSWTGARTRQIAGNIVCTLVLAVTSAVGLNVLLALTGFTETSDAYREVARQQYSVAFGVGAVLFGLFSPIAEEVVFRGLIFNRLRTYCGAAVAVVVSGVLFGVYHGNLVQGVYGGCMGMLMAWVYLRAHSFFYPCLFHAVANLAVFALAQNASLHARLFTAPGCALLLAVAAADVLLLEKIRSAQRV